MKRRPPGHLALALSVFVPLAASCTSPHDDYWFPDEPVGGKADAVAIVLGADIPSGFVNPAAAYLHDRRIASLAEVGALDSVALDLARRVDGIIANLPADGRMHVAELVRMEEPPFFDSLFPDEKAALPTLWPLLEAATGSDQFAGVNLAPFEVTDISTDPSGGLVTPDLLDIATLPSELRDAAERLELLFDSDGSDTTVTIADLEDGLAAPGPFTQAELDDFAEIIELFHARSVSAADARLRVLVPGTEEFAGSIGPVELAISSNVRYFEQRKFRQIGHSTPSWTGALRGMRTVSASISLDAGARVLVIHHDTGDELVFGSGDAPAKLTAGVYVFEVWQDSDRVFSTNATLPDMSGGTETLNLDEFLDYAIETIDGDELFRNLEDAEASGDTSTAVFTHDLEDLPIPSHAANLADKTSSPTVALPTGRYTRDAKDVGAVQLDVYPNNVLRVTIGGETKRMRFGARSSTPPKLYRAFFSIIGASNVRFFPGESTLHVGDGTFASTRLHEVITANMRDD